MTIIHRQDYVKLSSTERQGFNKNRVVGFPALSGFPLTDAHAQADCTSCHNPADYSLLFPTPSGPQDCVACHQAEYNEEHAGTGFSTN